MPCESDSFCLGWNSFIPSSCCLLNVFGPTSATTQGCFIEIAHAGFLSFAKTFILAHACWQNALCHNHRTTCHKYMTCVRMIFTATACIAGEKETESKASWIDFPDWSVPACASQSLPLWQRRTASVVEYALLDGEFVQTSCAMKPAHN